ncbi:hypothetical protein T11_6078 [Trichinella zimbabwensis]|uniref:Uncharacterized protein n=1 Tax=Trichinella zimbabwensis TaxID=268475 RepID=A0A0V1GG61_9BILA|nr:hypothetical protein T11_6078 [Trichinella zimbabwensis]
MQITIAITVPYHQYREWRREKKIKMQMTQYKNP